MTTARVLFLTQRGLQQQQWALEGAPPELKIIMRREPPRAEILQLLPEMDFLISERSGEVDAEMIAAGRRLRLIQRIGLQTWDLDLEAARQAGLPVCYRPISGCVLVAEHMLLQILGLFKRLRDAMVVSAEARDWGRPPRQSDEDTFAYNWSGRTGIRSLQAAVIGILGLGEIGLELAWRLRGFGCRVLYHKRRRLPAEAEARFQVSYATPDEIAAQSDVICNLLPYSGPVPTVNAAFLARLQPGAYLVSCGSGDTVDNEAVLAALKSGHLAGAALDTYNWEPLRPDDPLLELARDPGSNLILTPHIAAGGLALDSTAKHRAGDYENLLRVL
ncbi:MAG: hypothetical protein JNK29_02140, partial [Anaerolineales bacterium]|nr:hypothetical protein [Anaerolineales bacterium]